MNWTVTEFEIWRELMDTSTADILRKLRAPFPQDRIHWRVGATNRDKTKGIALAYLDARDVMYRLDDLVGADWQCRYSHVTEKVTVCEIGIKIDGDWRWRSNGAGDTSYEAEKGALSDAFKRAAVLWGIGRYLYSLPNEWCDIEQAGRTFKLKRTPTLPPWALPAETPDGSHVPTLHDAVLAHATTISAIKDALAVGDLSKGKEAWDELTDGDKRALWVAPSKGGPFTTKERAIMHSKEFRTANGGTA